MPNKLLPRNDYFGKIRRYVFTTALLGELIILITCLSLGLSRSFILAPVYYLAYIKWISAILLGAMLLVLIYSTKSYLKFFVALIILVLLVGAQFLVIFSKDSNKYYAYGWKLAHRGNYEDAIKYLDMSIVFNSRNADAYYERGYANDRKGNYQAAIDDFNKVIQLDPQSFESFWGLGSSFYQQKDYPRAIYYYSRAIILNPKNPKIYKNRGDAYISISDYSSAILDYDKAIQIDPKYFRSYVGRGWAFYYIKNFEKAAQDWKRAVVINPALEKELQKWINNAENQAKL